MWYKSHLYRLRTGSDENDSQPQTINCTQVIISAQRWDVFMFEDQNVHIISSTIDQVTLRCHNVKMKFRAAEINLLWSWLKSFFNTPTVNNMTQHHSVNGTQIQMSVFFIFICFIFLNVEYTVYIYMLYVYDRQKLCNIIMYFMTDDYDKEGKWWQLSLYLCYHSTVYRCNFFQPILHFGYGINEAIHK